MVIVGSSRCAHVLPIPVSLAGQASVVNCSTSADVSGEPVMRSARAKACRRIAAVRHRSTGCSQAPRPGWEPDVSALTAQSPFSVDTTTTRSSPTANSRFRQPIHVRTGPPVGVSAAEFSRWITHHSTVTAAGFGTKPGPGAQLLRAGGVPGWTGLRFRGGGVTADVDPPTGQPGGEPGVLPLLADGQRQLKIRHGHPG